MARLAKQFQGKHLQMQSEFTKKFRVKNDALAKSTVEIKQLLILKEKYQKAIKGIQTLVDGEDEELTQSITKILDQHGVNMRANDYLLAAQNSEQRFISMVKHQDIVDLLQIEQK